MRKRLLIFTIDPEVDKADVSRTIWNVLDEVLLGRLAEKFKDLMRDDQASRLLTPYQAYSGHPNHVNN